MRKCPESEGLIDKRIPATTAWLGDRGRRKKKKRKQIKFFSMEILNEMKML